MWKNWAFKLGVNGKWLETSVSNTGESKLLFFGKKQLFSFIQQICAEPNCTKRWIQKQKRLIHSLFSDPLSGETVSHSVPQLVIIVMFPLKDNGQCFTHLVHLVNCVAFQMLSTLNQTKISINLKIIWTRQQSWKWKNNTQKIQCNIKKRSSQITPMPIPK